MQKETKTAKLPAISGIAGVSEASCRACDGPVRRLIWPFFRRPNCVYALCTGGCAGDTVLFARKAV